MAGGSKSKTKGSTFERDLGKFLGETFNGSFIRSNNSGAQIGGKNSFKKNIFSKGQVLGLKGDLVAPDHMPKFVVEAKFYSEFRFHQLLQPGAVPQLDEWVSQCLQVVDPDDFWVIVFKINLRGIYVAIPEAFAPNFVFGNHAVYTGDYGTFRVTDMKTFFTANKEAVLKLSA
jgi:hypothetical protein